MDNKEYKRMASFSKILGNIYGTQQLKEEFNTEFSEPWSEMKIDLEEYLKINKEKSESYRKDKNELIEKLEKLTIKDKDYFLNKIHSCENICLLLNEKSLYSIIELIPVSIMTLDLDMNITYINKKFKETFDLYSIINRNVEDIFNPEREYGFTEINKELYIDHKVIGNYNKFLFDYRNTTYNVVQIFITNKYYVRMYYL